MGVRETRYIFGALVFSVLGDQLARVALSILVYSRTGSPLLTALTYAVTFLPWVVGGPILAAYADRLPRRSVMIGCDLGRAVLVGMLVIPGIPLIVLVALLFVATMFAPPFESARSALMPEILQGDRYVVGNALITNTYQMGQVFGFIGGGALVALITARGALAADATTFLISAALIRIGVRHRARAQSPDARRTSLLQETSAGLRLVLGTPRLRSIVLLVCTASAFAFAWEGIAAPWAAQLGGGPRTVGLLLGVSPIGMVVGAFVLGRLCRPSTRERLMLPLAVAGPLVLGLVLLDNRAPVALAAVVISGLAVSFNIPLNAVFMLAIDPAFRGRAFGVVQSGLQAAQGLSILLAGAVADRLAPSTTVGVFGLVGAVIVALAARSYRRAPAPLPAPAA